MEEEVTSNRNFMHARPKQWSQIKLIKQKEPDKGKLTGKIKHVGKNNSRKNNICHLDKKMGKTVDILRGR